MKEKQRQRETERQRKGESERDRQRERDREREETTLPCAVSPSCYIGGVVSLSLSAAGSDRIQSPRGDVHKYTCAQLLGAFNHTSELTTSAVSSTLSLPTTLSLTLCVARGTFHVPDTVKKQVAAPTQWHHIALTTRYPTK